MANASELRQELAVAERHIAASTARIARQRQLVRKLEADGHDAADGKELLRLMEDALSAIDAHRQQIVRELTQTRDSSLT